MQDCKSPCPHQRTGTIESDRASGYLHAWVISMSQLYWKLGQAPPIYAGGCWTGQQTNYQAWNIYSSDGPRPPAFAVWDTYSPQGWLAYSGYTCQ